VAPSEGRERSRGRAARLQAALQPASADDARGCRGGGDRDYGACHDRSRFAFIAFPLSRGYGRQAFSVNADNTIWRYDLAETYSATLRPIGPGRESTSELRGTGQAALDDATTFPQNPSFRPAVWSDD